MESILKVKTQVIGLLWAYQQLRPFNKSYFYGGEHRSSQHWGQKVKVSLGSEETQALQCFSVTGSKIRVKLEASRADELNPSHTQTRKQGWGGGWGWGRVGILVEQNVKTVFWGLNRVFPLRKINLLPLTYSHLHTRTFSHAN